MKQGKFRKLHRHSAHRRALFRNLVGSLIEKNKIITTLEKAKDLRIYADKLVTWTKNDTYKSTMKTHGFLYQENLALTALREFPTRFADRNGGYTRITPLMRLRRGDGARLAIIEYLDADKQQTELREEINNVAKQNKERKEKQKKLVEENKKLREMTKKNPFSPETTAALLSRKNLTYKPIPVTKAQ